MVTCDDDSGSVCFRDPSWRTQRQGTEAMDLVSIAQSKGRKTKNKGKGKEQKERREGRREKETLSEASW